MANPVFTRPVRITCSVVILYEIRVAKTLSIHVPYQERANFAATQLAPTLSFLL